MFTKSQNTKSRLEQITGKRVIFRLYEGENREVLESSFENVYFYTREYMDFFDSQFDLIRAIYFERFVRGLARVRILTRNLTINTKNFPKEWDFLPHELAHLWHSKLEFTKQSKFEEDWLKISENHYGKYDMGSHIINGAVSTYALTNIDEDVAETATLVNEIKTRRVINPIFSPYRKVIEKIKLLRDYEFVSDVECQTATKAVEQGFELGFTKKSVLDHSLPDNLSYKPLEIQTD